MTKCPTRVKCGDTFKNFFKKIHFIFNYVYRYVHMTATAQEDQERVLDFLELGTTLGSPAKAVMSF